MEERPFSEIVSYLAQTITTHLDNNERVLWLVPGGSLMSAAVEVSQRIADNTNIANLSVTLTDERYGEPGHDNENWKQLMEAGFSLPEAHLYRVLNGVDGEATTLAFSQMLDTTLADVDYSIGLFGVGTDSHIAGIKPNSPSVTESSLASFYEGEDFERVTITFDAIKRLDEVIVAAKGKEKAPVIDALLHKDIPLAQSPAHIVRQLRKVLLFTD